MFINRPQYKDSRTSWIIVIYLAAFYAFSMIDRTIFILLADPIALSLGISDTEMALVLGAGFAVTYSIAGVPMAHWIDNRSRRPIIAAGVTLWSAMTICAAFSDGFWSLLFFRSGLAFGEAVLTPAAVSLIGDLFPKDRRTLPMSIYASMAGIFSTGAFAVGAATLRLAQPLAESTGFEAWRITLVLLGAPTMMLASLFYIFTSEPKRVEQTGSESMNTKFFIDYLRLNFRLFAPLYFGTGLIFAFGYGFIVWVPTILIRDHGISAVEGGFIFGLLGVGGGLVGTLLLPQLMRPLERIFPGKAIPVTYMCLSATLIPMATLMPASQNRVVFYASGFFVIIVTSTWMVLTSMLFQTYADSKLRARLIAIWLLFANLMGLALGPVLATQASSLFSGDERSLAHGIVLLGAITTPAALLCFIFVYRSMSRNRSIGA